MSMTIPARLNRLEKQVSELEVMAVKGEESEARIIVKRLDAADFEKNYLTYMAKLRLGLWDLSQKRIFVSKQLKEDEAGKFPFKPSDLSAEQAERILQE